MTFHSLQLKAIRQVRLPRWQALVRGCGQAGVLMQ